MTSIHFLSSHHLHKNSRDYRHLAMSMRITVYLAVIAASLSQGSAFTLQGKPNTVVVGSGLLRKPSFSRFVSSYKTPSCLRSTAEAEDISHVDSNRKRFDRIAETDIRLDKPCVMKIGDGYYDMTNWAKAHPGGAKVLEKFHNKDATKAFYNVGHSKQAEDMLSDFLVDPPSDVAIESEKTVAVPVPETKPVPRWRKKLFTHEDPIGMHKYFGIFCLLHFIYRFGRALSGDAAAGFGIRGGKGASIIPMLCLIPHLILSGSSLIFETVPRERVVGRPMIWKEFRVHSILFAYRGLLCTFFSWLAIMKPSMRKLSVIGNCVTVFTALVLADVATAKLKPYKKSGTTATMPYWDGCSPLTMKAFKTFYAYSQFAATTACLLCSNPMFGFYSVMPIQIAAFVMTLIRKGLASPKVSHSIYAASLVVPSFLMIAGIPLLKSPLEVVTFLGTSIGIFKLRTLGVNKYAMWLPLIAARLTFLDKFITIGVY